jgi:hypothetical protein
VALGFGEILHLPAERWLPLLRFLLSACEGFAAADGAARIGWNSPGLRSNLFRRAFISSLPVHNLDRCSRINCTVLSMSISEPQHAV